MRRCNRPLRLAFLAALGGTCLQFGACSPGGVARFVANLNPCGTILNCDPVTYRFVTSGYEGPGADPGVDPACTFPPFCANDPFVSSVPAGQ